MASERFKVVDVNPNDSCGGGGCLCSEVKETDCQGPFVVFYAQEMENNLSPNAVACKACILTAAQLLEGEVLAGGERANEPQVIELSKPLPYEDEPHTPPAVKQYSTDDDIPEV